MSRTAPSPAAKLVEDLLRQECESAHCRIVQANSGREKDRVEGVLGFRRGVKKIRCALLLSAGGFSPRKRIAIDAQWAALARRLGTFRDFDASLAEVNQIIPGLPADMREAARQAWLEECADPGGQASQADRQEILQHLVADTERVIAATESLQLDDLTPELITATVRHVWKRARAQAGKSWKGRDEAWLHRLRKRIQQTHIVFRLLREQTGRRGQALERGFDAAAKSMGRLRDISIIHRKLAARNPPPPPLAALRIAVRQRELAAAKSARKLVQKAFKPKMTRVLHDMVRHVRSL